MHLMLPCIRDISSSSSTPASERWPIPLLPVPHALLLAAVCLLGVEPSQQEMVALPSSIDNWIKCQAGVHVAGHYMDDYYIALPDIEECEEARPERSCVALRPWASG